MTAGHIFCLYTCIQVLGKQDFSGACPLKLHVIPPDVHVGHAVDPLAYVEQENVYVTFTYFMFYMLHVTYMRALWSSSLHIHTQASARNTLVH